MAHIALPVEASGLLVYYRYKKYSAVLAAFATKENIEEKRNTHVCINSKQKYVI